MTEDRTRRRLRWCGLLFAAFLVAASGACAADAGVRAPATGFARRVDKPPLDSLLALPEWDEGLAREIQFRQFVPWGYREYLDVLEAAWRLNRSLPPGAPPFRVIGVNNEMDPSFCHTEADFDDPTRRRLVFGGRAEADWAAPVLHAAAAGEKVLAYCDIRHAFSGCRRPRVRDGVFTEFGVLRFGNHLRAALGGTVVTVFLHGRGTGPAGTGTTASTPAAGVSMRSCRGARGDRSRWGSRRRAPPSGICPWRTRCTATAAGPSRWRRSATDGSTPDRRARSSRSPGSRGGFTREASNAPAPGA